MSKDKDILSVDSDDENVDIKSLLVYLEEDTKRNKNHAADELNGIGEDLLLEIEEKNKRKNVIKAKQIKYIIKHSPEYIFNQLESFSYQDVRDIYNEIRSKGNYFNKIFRFIFNL